MQVNAPCAGHVIPITEVGDPTFAGQIVGPGVESIRLPDMPRSSRPPTGCS